MSIINSYKLDIYKFILVIYSFNSFFFISSIVDDCI